MKKIIAIFLLMLLVVPQPCRAQPSTAGVIDIGTRRELFIDDYLIESMSGAQFELHHPVPANVAIHFDKPWEGRFSAYVTVIQDGDLYRMYYRGLPVSGKDGSDREVTCYAESRDGKVWNKPSLGIHEFDGSRDNNIILMNEAPFTHNFAPFLDSNPKADPDQRYKALAGIETSGLVAFVSADGKHWTRLRQEAVFQKGIFDSQNVSFWSESEQTYVCYFRTWTGGNNNFRTVSRTTSTDFVNWSEPQIMQYSVPLQEHLYTNQTTPYFRAPHIYLGLAARFMPGRKVITPSDKIDVEKRYAGDCSDTVLLTSRGGYRYDRKFMESFLRPGLGQPNWVSRSNYMARGIVPTDESEISMFLGRHYGQPSAHLQRYVLRPDGFSSVAAGYSGGTVTTRPLQFSPGRDLTLNMSTSAAGSIRVELQDLDGQTLSGFALGDCDELIGDQLERVVSWKGSSNLSALADQHLRLKFAIKDANIYSFRFR